MKLSIVIPVYNEEQTIGEVVERVWADDLGDLEREVIIANDGSTDATREALDGIRLRCVGFDFEPEITARFLRAGHRILEVPIRYNPRRTDEGKKIRWIDGVDAVYALLKC